MSQNDRLIEIICEFEEQVARGVQPSLDDLCRDCPELKTELERRLPYLFAFDVPREESEQLDYSTVRPTRIGTDELATITTERGSNSSAARLHPEHGKLVELTNNRFQTIRFYARGGLGEVFVAVDHELGREVALKQIREQHADDRRSRTRFLNEARITANLEHPGIVPVYSLGFHQDGRPYYAMRFLKGETLKEATQAFHQSKKFSQDEGARVLAMQGLLRRFLDVCNTISYAHSKSILHRDLKPANIIIGSYGETQVLDWGLAKNIGDIVIESDAPGSSSSFDHFTVDETQPGEVVGTPAYMSPEQAKGDPSQIGPAVDIYGLGATLYYLLTNQAPFQSKHGYALRAQVESGQFSSPRQVRPSIPKALEAICLKAMALDPADRYETASALGQDIERWLADEPVTAWREPFLMRSRRWVRRHQSAVVTGTVAVLFLLLLFGINLTAMSERRLRVAISVTAALDVADTLLSEARAERDLVKLDLAQSRLQAANDLLNATGGNTGVKMRAEHAQDLMQMLEVDLQFLNQLDKARTPPPDSGFGMLDVLGSAELYEMTWKTHQVDPLADDEYLLIDRLGREGLGVEFAVHLDDWADSVDIPERSRLLRIASAIDPDPIRNQIRDAVAAGTSDPLTKLASTINLQEQSSITLNRLAQALLTLDSKIEAINLLERAFQRDPGNSWFCYELSRLLDEDSHQKSRAVEYAYAAVALRPDDPDVRGQLAVALSNVGREAEAIAVYRFAIALDPPGRWWLHANLANALLKTEQFEESLKQAEQILEIEPTMLFAYDYIVPSLYKLGRVDEAIATSRTYLKQLTSGDFSESISFEDSGLAAIYFELADMLLTENRLDEATEAFKQSLQVDPSYTDSHTRLGNVFVKQGQIEAGLASLRKAIELDPKFPGYRHNLGEVLVSVDRLDEAARVYQEAIVAIPDEPSFAQEHFEILETLGHYNEAIRTLRKGEAIDPTDPYFPYQLGRMFQELGRYDEAISCFERTKGLDPDNPENDFQIADSLNYAGRNQEAISVYQKVIKLDPGNPDVYLNYSVALKAVGEIEQALAMSRKAMQIDPTAALAYLNHGAQLMELGRYEEALDFLRTADSLGRSQDPDWSYPTAELIEQCLDYTRIDF